MRALLLLAVLAAAACTPDFAAASDVTDLRVLAIQAEPPEAQFDADAGTVQPVAVRMLVVDPSRDAGVTVSLQVCGPTDSRRCDQGPSSDAGPVSLPFTLPAGDTLPAFDPRELLGNDKLGDYGGIRVQLSLTVDDGSANGPVHASKTIIYSPVTAPCAPNRNPALGRVRLSILGADAGVLAQDAGLSIGTEYGLRPELAPGAEEQYCTLDLGGQLVTLKEQAHYAFFTGPGGEFDVDTADEPLDGGAPPDGLARFTPHADAGTIWIVVRDGRGGESWIESQWTAN